jgi:tryptophan halogenase
MSRPIARVVVVGRDAAGWLSAFALQRAFGRTGLTVHMIELPSRLSAVEVYAALPTLANLHRLLGLDDNEVVSACAGVYVQGQRFSNWSKAKPAFMHAYDTQGVAINHVDFIQYWVKARAEGLAVDLEDFCLGAAAAKQNRYVLRNDTTDAFSNAAHGYHLDARTYVRLLKQCALKTGVVRTTGQVASVNRSGAHIQSVVLSDGQIVEGDLFIDASGVEAALIGAMPEAPFESWRHWFGADRIMAVSGKRLAPLPAFSQISAHINGWIGLYPLQNRTAIKCVYDSSSQSDEKMAEAIGVMTGLRIESEVVVAPLQPGARARPWVGNCIALGEAAVVLEPLDALHLHVIQLGLSRLIGFFPVEADALVEADIYNADITAHINNIRDFQIAHYKLNQRFDDPVWDRAREMSIPESLVYKLNLFAQRGRVALYDHESFEIENWNAIFVGHGVMPRTYDPLADALPREELIAKFKGMLRFIAEEVRTMPSLDAHLEIHAPYGGARQAT